MLSLFLSMMLALNFLCSPAYADVPPPEPAEESTDTSTGDTAEGADEKSGCSSTGANISLSMLPILLIGLATLARTREE